MIRKPLLAIFVILLTAILSFPSFAADDESALDASHRTAALRTFAPVQDGFTNRGVTALPYAPDRLLVQIKSDAAGKSLLGTLTDKGAQAPGNEIGLESLDELADEAGVLAVERPYIRVANAGKAADLGVDRWLMYRFEGPADLADIAARFRADGSDYYSQRLGRLLHVSDREVPDDSGMPRLRLLALAGLLSFFSPPQAS